MWKGHMSHANLPINTLLIISIVSRRFRDASNSFGGVFIKFYCDDGHYLIIRLVLLHIYKTHFKGRKRKPIFLRLNPNVFNHLHDYLQ